jgi:long-chain fatty acid transport protein
MVMATNLKGALLLSTGVTLAALASVAPASAGAFLLREQSAAGLALSTAGAAAGGAGLGSMFWNGATITDYEGWQSSWSVSGIMPDSQLTAKAGSTLLPLAPFGTSAKSGDIGQDAVLPASYTSYQLNDKIWLGLAINTPFGLTTAAPNNWAGSTQGITTKIASYNINPTLAYKINDMVSVSAGVQAMYFKTYLRQAIDLPGFQFNNPPFPNPAPFSGTFHDASVKGNSWGFGFTLGATLKPVDGTEIGIGYRSSVTEKVKGNINFSEQIILAGPTLIQPLPVGSYPAQLNIKLPDVLTIGLRQRVTRDFTMLAGFEWDHWSTVNLLPIFSRGPFPPAGTTYETLAIRYKNGWLASLGGEYKWSQALTLRGGIAYEKSPIQNDNRLSILPDSDRIWTSIGAGWKITNKLTADVSYAHLFARNGTIDQTSSTGVRLVADTRSHVDIVSVGLTYRWDDPAPVHQETLVRKY